MSTLSRFRPDEFTIAMLATIMLSLLAGALKRVRKMAMKTALRITGWSLAGMTLFTAGFALGQYPAPTDYKGLKNRCWRP
jgi:hypothetical protein